MINFIYSELRDVGIDQNYYEFSEHWLGMERNYFYIMRSKGRGPSAKALSHCATRLVALSAALEAENDVAERVKSVRIRCLAQMCVREMLPEQVRIVV